MGEHRLICHACSLPFDEEVHRPKMLQCGHTFCLACLVKISTTKVVCPSDRLEFPGLPNNLPDNYYILGMKSNQTVKRFWCLHCDKEADSKCIDEHPVVNYKGRMQHLKEKLFALKEKSGDDLVTVLVQKLHNINLPDLPAGFNDHVIKLSELKTRTQAAFEGFQKALKMDGEESKVALTALEEETDHLSSLTSMWQDALELLSTQSSCTITVENPSWVKLDGQLQFGPVAGNSPAAEDMNLLRYLLFRMYINGLLTKRRTGEMDHTEQRMKLDALTDTQCMSLCDKPNIPFGEEDTLDFIRLHDELGSEKDEKQLRQHIESSKVVRKLIGVEHYDKVAPLNSPGGFSHLHSLMSCVSMALRRHKNTLEEVSVCDVSQGDLVTLLAMPRLRKLHISGTAWLDHSPAGLRQPHTSGGSALQCVTLAAHAGFVEVLRCCTASLREVVVKDVPLPVDAPVGPVSSDHDDGGGQGEALLEYAQHCRQLQLELGRLVAQCGRLRCLTLVRPGPRARCPGGPACAAQLDELRRAAPAAAAGFAARCRTCSPAYAPPPSAPSVSAERVGRSGARCVRFAKS